MSKAPEDFLAALNTRSQEIFKKIVERYLETGMPVGSPGMEVEGMEPDTYDVVLFGKDGRTTFARYRGEELA